MKIPASRLRLKNMSENSSIPVMTRVAFGVVPVSTFFKESPDGAWHLKVSDDHGEYRSAGVSGRPKFGLNELVYIHASGN